MDQQPQGQPTPPPAATAAAPVAYAGSPVPPGGVAPTGMAVPMQMGQATADQQRRPHLYVGSLSPRVTEYMLTEIFAVAGPVASAKIIPDRNFQHGGLNYGFVEYHDQRSAEQALQTLNGRKIFDTEIRVNWAYQGQTGAPGVPGQPGAPGAPREDTVGHFHVFVGDLGPEVNDEALGKAFGAFGTLSEARVMWDMNSGKSRGYGFLAFRDKADAEQAIATMNGEWLGSRAIRVNWANQKTQTGGGGFGRPGGAPGGGGGGAPAGPQDYQSILALTPSYNTTVYVGNLIPYSTQADLIPLFQGYGYIVEIRMQADRGFAFVKLDSHENAANAICHLQNVPVHGRPIKCSWGKDRESGAGGAGGSVPQNVPQPQPVGMPGMMPGVAGAYPGMMQQQMYIPQANYAQYGYPYNAYAASPAMQVPGASPIAGTPGAGAAGTPGAQQAYADPAAAAAAAAYYQQAANNQWSAYYGGQPAQPPNGAQPGQPR